MENNAKIAEVKDFIVWQEWSGIDKLFKVLYYCVYVLGCETQILE